jgi:hypothetical protein
MDGEEFVKRLIPAVRDSSISGVKRKIDHPPGREPRESLVRLSDWYNSLPATDKEQVGAVIVEAIDSALFGVLCVLDGVRAISDVGPREELVLLARGLQGDTLVNDPAADFLHDIYQEVTGKFE